MTSSVDAQNLTQTANAYKLLSLLYGSPTEELEEVLTHLEQTLQSLRPELIPLVLEMKTLSDSEAKLEELTVDHTRLFIGPFDLLAPPYGSIYLDGQRQVMGDSTMEVLQFYRQAGLNLAADFKQPPDYIVTELEFIYYLIGKYLETEDEQWLVQMETFLNKYLGKWSRDFTSRINEHAKNIFYKNLAHLTLEIIQK
ncbi:molecular chaperone [Desulfosporosinus sp. BICA1-9]|uniref:TorD/DmsD family molecular chaperone n=1 Tax=Desulfosporosinus sp. BICA1-9 TaxID=1531958 RepID=UPI00054B70DE|nr:molecular chaperone TorD family protein [Desulfosporosinus sp. BICA1-9]KJS46167.1 MAG: dehydrogenase [Peptococcaceae bacterium BRH_c23]KJS90080.1 MAG: dehydrogenase [Desulfosporosinus sp. BICA1-9]HBW36319.1 dehydrogenase [Desulfosporosinus sp.]